MRLDNCIGEIINVGVDKGTSFLELAKTIVSLSASGNWEYCEFTSERKAQEPGDFISDIRKIKNLTGWTPQTTLQEGVQKTIDYYKKYKKHYWI